MPNRVEITILVEDGGGESLTPEHGLAVWIRAGGVEGLLDAGQGKALVGNAAHLGMDLAQAQFLVLSHGHYDHSGGLAAFLEHNRLGPILFAEGALDPRWSLRPPSAPREIGIPRSAREALNKLPPERIVPLDSPRFLGEGLGLTGPIPRTSGFEDPGGPFFLDREGFTPDPIRDDQALWIATEEGTVIVLGCAHAGVVNTVEFVQKISPGPIRALVGGFHLLEAGPERLDLTIRALRKVDPDLIVPCHCTGDRAVQELSRAFPGRVIPGRAGMTLEFAGEKKPGEGRA